MISKNCSVISQRSCYIPLIVSYNMLTVDNLELLVQLETKSCAELVGQLLQSLRFRPHTSFHLEKSCNFQSSRSLIVLLIRQDAQVVWFHMHSITPNQLLLKKPKTIHSPQSHLVAKLISQKRLFRSLSLLLFQPNKMLN